MTHFIIRTLRWLFLFYTVGATPTLFAAAEQAPAHTIDFKINGFFSAIGGRVVQKEPVESFSYNPRFQKCPCYIADYDNMGVYNPTFSLDPETRVGVQADASFTPNFGVTTQLVSRGTSMGPSLEWLYATYSFTPEWKLQLGRKRIPFYFYSEFQDVGFAYPWIGLPPELYGWEATNYNGASLRYTSSLGNTSFTGSLLSGRETIGNSPYYQIYGEERVRIVWSRLIGGDLEVNRGPYTARFVYLQSRYNKHDLTYDTPRRIRQHTYGLALNAEWEHSFVLTEMTLLSRNYFEEGFTKKSPAYSFGYGYRIGNWTPFLSYGSYSQRADNPDLTGILKWDRYSATLRYDLNATSALTFQIDRNRAPIDYTGENTIVRIAYDLIF